MLLSHLDAKLLKSSRPKNTTRRIRYSFRFISLIAPSPSHLPTEYHSSAYSPLPKRLLLRRSYLILSWLYYLTSATPRLKDKAQPSIAILPARTSKYTLTKAPMAHKTNSKEQFMFKFYKFKFSFNLSVEEDSLPLSPSQGAYALSLTKDLFPSFETNLLFLKTYEITYPMSINSYIALLSN